MADTVDKSTGEYKLSRIMYNAEACLEYLIAILVEGTFLARLTKELGFSDALTGIISSFISLGCLFQLISMFFRRRTVKRFVIILSILNQALFMLLYVIPSTPLPSGIKNGAFVAFIFIAYLVYNIAHPKKMSWLMSTVEDKKRGVFTATKEIISLAAGIIFSYAMGAVVDSCKSRGDLKTAFIICAAVIFVLMLLHTLSLLFVVEEPDTKAPEKTKALKSIFGLFREKAVLRVALLYVLWYIGNRAVVSFSGSYQTNELAFGQRFAVIIAAFGSVSRILFSRPFGKYADKHSFAALIRFCFILAAVSFVFTTLATPAEIGTFTLFGSSFTLSVGSVCFIAYHILHGIAQAGINSSLLNIVFDYVPENMRADALAFCSAIGGVVGFFTAIVLSPLVSHIQNAGNTFMGMHIYAQQVTSFIGVVYCVISAVYVSVVIMGRGKKRLK